jgi:drug/metabolite transporter (DMT)-like permease
MLLGSFSFSCMVLLSHQLAGRCDWRITALARSVVALSIAAAVARAAGVQLVFLRPPTLWVRSLAGSVSLVCTFYAQSLLRPPELLTITNTFPIWVAFLSWPLLRERPSGLVWVSALAGLLGVFLIQDPKLQGGAGAASLAFVASLSTAVAMLGLHRLQGLHPLAIVVHFSAVASCVCLALCMVGPGDPHWRQTLESSTFQRLLGIGITATVGQWFLTKAFAAGPPAKVSLVGLTQIVFAVGFDVALEHRSFEPATLLGIGLVMAPTAWVMAARAQD